MQPGDVYVLNDPYHGGTHLPDVTVVTPVFWTRPAPGRSSTWPAAATMPTSAASRPARCRRSRKTIDEEGVLIDNQLLVRGGHLLRGRVARLLGSGAVPGAQPRPDGGRPARPDRRQRKGRAGTARHGGAVRPATVAAYMQHVQDNAEESVRRVITALKDGAFTLPMDNGAQICVSLTVDAGRREATIDFTGTSAQTPEQLQRPQGGDDGGGAVCLPQRWWTTTSR
jgi:5-oxoprolinase (ATP-hydrolysing)